MHLDESWAGVTALARYRRARNNLNINAVIAYWDALRRDRLVPDRADIDPRVIEGALDNSFILERLNGRNARFRIAGRKIDTLLGVEARGVPFAALFAPPFRDQAGDILESVFRMPEVADLSLGPVGSGSGARLVLLPLKSDLGDITRALGCIALLEGRADVEQRFDIHQGRAIPLLAGRPVEWPGQDVRAMVPGLAETAKPFRPAEAPETARKAPHLRLVSSWD